MSRVEPGGGGVTRALVRFAQRPQVAFVAVFLGAFAVLVARRPETLTRAQFFAEDGRVFFVGAFFGGPLDVLFRPYNSYLHLLPRMTSLAESAVPAASAPLLGNALALTVVALVAAYLAGDRMAPLLPDPRSRLVAAVGFVLLAATHETLGSMTFIQAYVVVFLVAVAVAEPPRGRAGRALEALAVAASALSTPVAVVIAPLHLARSARYGRPALGSTLAITVAGIVQVVLLVREAAVPGIPADLTEMVRVGVLRLVVEPFWGATWTRLAADAGLPIWLWLLVGTAIVALLAVILSSWGRSSALALVVVAVGVGGLGIVRSRDFVAGLLDPLLLQRYFVVVGWLAIVVVARGMFSGSTIVRRASLVLAVFLVAGMTADFRLPAQPDLDWARRSACIGGPTPCVVPVFPVDAFSIYWPGRDGSYSQEYVTK